MMTIPAPPQLPADPPATSSPRTEFCLEIQYTWDKASSWFRRGEVFLGIGHARLCMAMALTEPHTRAARIIQLDIRETLRHLVVKPQLAA
jgi:hypothetical protein